MKVQLNKGKSIGKVLYIVEGDSTEPYILQKIFTEIFDYQVERILRKAGYSVLNSKEIRTSQVFVINTEQSNIKYIDKDNEYLNNLFRELIEEYDFDVDNAAIYYLFDRDYRSNKNPEFIKMMLKVLQNARENESYDRQGLLLLSYPAIESFTLANFKEDSFDEKFALGKILKRHLHEQKFNQSNITDETLMFAIEEVFKAFNKMKLTNYDIDAFGDCNCDIFDFEENAFAMEKVYNVLSLVGISLIDLGLVEVIE